MVGIAKDVVSISISAILSETFFLSFKVELCTPLLLLLNDFVPSGEDLPIRDKNSDIL